MPSGLCLKLRLRPDFIWANDSTDLILLLSNTFSTKERRAMHPSHPPQSRRPLLSLVLLIMAVIVLNACAANTPAASTTAPKAPVSIQLAWTHEYSSASFYAAEKN